MSIAHPCPGEWNWWASFDGCECFTIGPDATREEVIVQAIADGRGEYADGDVNWRTKFTIAQCRDNNVDLVARTMLLLQHVAKCPTNPMQVAKRDRRL